MLESVETQSHVRAINCHGLYSKQSLTRLRVHKVQFNESMIQQKVHVDLLPMGQKKGTSPL
jgi:hypothetical protein